MRWLLFSLRLILISASNIQDVKLEKEKLFSKELDLMIGHDIELNERELKVNKVFMDLKLAELKRGFQNPTNFTLFAHFFDYYEKVKSTNLYKLIKKMPKGAILHAHDIGFLPAEYLLGLTYWDKLYVCFSDDYIDFRFSNRNPKQHCKHPHRTRWQLMRDVRNSSGDVNKFDADLKRRFSMVVNNPNEQYADINSVWLAFQGIFISTHNLVRYKPAWEQYFYDTLLKARRDNVMYIEIRSTLPQLYDLRGKEYSSLVTAETYKKVVDRFKADYPDFLGAKLIFAPLRRATPQTIGEYINICKDIDRRIPGFIAGFDLVGQEDLGPPLRSFLPQLLEGKHDLAYFFHVGETNWNGLESDENLFDAIALGAKRLGHAFSIIKHPVLMQEVKKQEIALEVNVVSNIVLKLLSDVRNHPLAYWLATDMPVVISSDDPGLWGAEPLTHDYYLVFIAIANKHADLRMLKKLAMNSLYYSTFYNKKKMINEFEKRWSKFIDSVLR